MREGFWVVGQIVLNLVLKPFRISHYRSRILPPLLLPRHPTSGVAEVIFFPSSPLAAGPFFIKQVPECKYMKGLSPQWKLS